MKYIKKYVLVLIVIVSFSCSTGHNKNTVTFNYLRYFGRNETIKPINYNDNRWHHKNDSLLQKVIFKYKSREHEIRLYTNISDTDGAIASYELDSIGIIYCRSLAFRNFIQLTCDNDSITELITIAMGHMLLEPDLRCFGCNYSKYIKPLKYILPDSAKL